MTKLDFFHILCTYTPEELNKFISAKGKIKTVNAITFMNNEDDNLKNKKDNSDEKRNKHGI